MRVLFVGRLLIDHFHQQRNKKLYFLLLTWNELLKLIMQKTFVMVHINNIHVHAVHYWILKYMHGVVQLWLVQCYTVVYRWWFLYRAWKMCWENCGTLTALTSRGGRPRLGLANLGGKVPVIPMAMYKNEFKTAKPMIKMIPKKMLSNRPGSTTPTRRVGSCWRLLDHNNGGRAGESLVTSGWLMITFSTDSSTVQHTTALAVKSTSVKNTWLDTKWLERIMRTTSEISLELNVSTRPDFIYSKRHYRQLVHE